MMSKEVKCRDTIINYVFMRWNGFNEDNLKNNIRSEIPDIKTIVIEEDSELNSRLSITIPDFHKTSCMKSVDNVLNKFTKVFLHIDESVQ